MRRCDDVENLLSVVKFTEEIRLQKDDNVKARLESRQTFRIPFTYADTDEPKERESWVGWVCPGCDHGNFSISHVPQKELEIIQKIKEQKIRINE